MVKIKTKQLDKQGIPSLFTENMTWSCLEAFSMVMA